MIMLNYYQDWPAKSLVELLAHFVKLIDLLDGSSSMAARLAELLQDNTTVSSKG